MGDSLVGHIAGHTAAGDSLVGGFAWQSFVSADSVVRSNPAPSVSHTVVMRGEPRMETIASEVWYTPMLMLAFLIYSVVLAARRKAIVTEIVTFFNPRIRGSIFGFEWMNNSPYKLALSCLGVLMIGCTMYFLALWDLWQHSRPTLFLACVGLAVVYMVAKGYVLNLFHYVFFPELEFSPSEAMLIVVRFAGFVLIPYVLCAGYGSVVLSEAMRYYAAAALVGLELVFVSKLFLNLCSGIASLFYLFLYILTLEVFPVLGVMMVIKSIV